MLCIAGCIVLVAVAIGTGEAVRFLLFAGVLAVNVVLLLSPGFGADERRAVRDRRAAGRCGGCGYDTA